MGKAILVGPVVFAMVGALSGVSLAMLSPQDPRYWGRMHFETSVPLTFAGLLIGTVVGLLLMLPYLAWPRTRPPIVLIGATLLAISMGAPIGWLVGDSEARNFYEHARLTRQGMAAGAIVGAGAGLLLGAIQVVWVVFMSSGSRRAESRSVSAAR